MKGFTDNFEDLELEMADGESRWIQMAIFDGRDVQSFLAVHKIDVVHSYIPNKQQGQIRPELRALFYQKDRQAPNQATAAFIEKYQKLYSFAIECLQGDLEACLTFYNFPKEHWKTIRTNDAMERLFEEVKSGSI
jgi:transposase-like protein